MRDVVGCLTKLLVPSVRQNNVCMGCSTSHTPVNNTISATIARITIHRLQWKVVPIERQPTTLNSSPNQPKAKLTYLSYNLL
jgi:hypothetical protein